MGKDIALGNGLYRVVQKSGHEAWAVRYRSPMDKRRQMKVTLGNCKIIPLKEARRWANELLGDVAKEPVDARKKAQGEEWEHAVERFLKHGREHNRPSTVYAAGRVLKHHVPWKGRRIGTITWRDVSGVLDGIKARGAPVQANRVFSTLRRFFNFAIQQELLDRNPCERKSKPSKEVSRDRVLSDAELRQIWMACTEYPYGPLVRMLMLTRQRRDEVASAVWDEFQDGVCISLGSAPRTADRTTFRSLPRW